MVEVRGETYEYVVVAQADGTAHRITSEDDLSVFAPRTVPALTLTSHHPRCSSRQRIVVQAELVGPPNGLPVGPAAVEAIL